MSAPVISDLFQQIVHSEEKIKERFEALKKVNQDIQEHQEKIRNTKYETEAFRGNLAILNHKLMQEQIEEKWLRMREKILIEQKQESLSENEKLLKEIGRLGGIGKDERESFLDDCTKFLKDFDLCTDDDSPNFEENMKEELQELQKEYESVLKDINLLELRDQERRSLEQKKCMIDATIDTLSRKKRGLLESLNNLKSETKHLKAMKENLIKKSKSCPELQSILSDIEASKNQCSMLSEQHRQHATELYQLQQSLMQREHRKRKELKPTAWNVAGTSSTSRSVNNPAIGRKRFHYKPMKKVTSPKESSHKNDKDLLFPDPDLESFDFEFSDNSPFIEISSMEDDASRS